MKFPLIKSVALSKFAAMGALAAMVCGCAGQVGDEATGDQAQATGSGCTGTSKTNGQQCIEVDGTGLNVRVIKDTYGPNPENVLEGHEVCGQHHVWDQHGHSYYSARVCVPWAGENSHAFTINKDFSQRGSGLRRIHQRPRARLPNRPQVNSARAPSHVINRRLGDFARGASAIRAHGLAGAVAQSSAWMEAMRRPPKRNKMRPDVDITERDPTPSHEEEARCLGRGMDSSRSSPGAPSHLRRSS